LDQVPAKTDSAAPRKDEQVVQIGERGEIGDYPAESSLLASDSVVQPVTPGVIYRAIEEVAESVNLNEALSRVSY
jgi:hypothetical protein